MQGYLAYSNPATCSFPFKNANPKFHGWTAVLCDLEGLVMSSHERRYVSFQLLQSLLPTLSANEVGVVFSPNLMGCLMNNSRSSGNYLYPVARHLVSCRGNVCV